MEFHLPSFDQPEKSLHIWIHPIYILVSCFFTTHINIILPTSLNLLSDLVLSGFPTELSVILRYLTIRPSTSTIPVQDVQNLTSWSTFLTTVLKRPTYITAHAKYLILFMSPVLCPASLFQSDRRRRKMKIVNKEISKHVTTLKFMKYFVTLLDVAGRKIITTFLIPAYGNNECRSLFCQLIQTRHDAGLNTPFIFALPHTSIYTFEQHLHFTRIMS